MDSARVLLAGNHTVFAARNWRGLAVSQEVIPLDADTHPLARTDRQQGEGREGGSLTHMLHF